jgi:hypothetical protein
MAEIVMRIVAPSVVRTIRQTLEIPPLHLQLLTEEETFHKHQRRKQPMSELRSRLYFLWHPGTDRVFSGYGLAVDPERPDWLIGILMIDRPRRADVGWLSHVRQTFGRCDLFTMAQDGSRGMACQMYIEKNSEQYLIQIHTDVTEKIAEFLSPLLFLHPEPKFKMEWDSADGLWTSSFATEVSRGGIKTPRFALGQIVATPGAIDALQCAQQSAQEFLSRHVTGDWGELDEHDKELNELGAAGENRILSRYILNNQQVIWIITEWDRSVTTLLLPSEY